MFLLSQRLLQQNRAIAFCQSRTGSINQLLPRPLPPVRPVVCRYVHASSDDTGETTTVKQILKESAEALIVLNVSDPDLSVQHLLASALDLSWETGWRDVPHMADRVPSVSEKIKFDALLQERLKHTPLQYILGKWDFLDYTLAIQPPLLCPRPETEELVELVLKDIAAIHSSGTMDILDVGCGTGAIGIVLAHQLADSNVVALDVEPVAVAVSNENAESILTGSTTSYEALLQSLQDYSPQMKFDVVVSNPPYIPSRDMEGLSKGVKDFESHVALCGGGEDGLDTIWDIIDKLPHWCRSGAICWMEVDASHPKLLEAQLPQRSDKVEYVGGYKDMFGLDRFVKMRVL